MLYSAYAKSILGNIYLSTLDVLEVVAAPIMNF